MSKFNESVVAEKTTVNYMGEKAVKYDSKLKLVTLLLTSFVDDSYYEKQPDMLNRLQSVINKCDAKFVAKSAIYARTVFGMRSITHVVAALLAKKLSGEVWSKNFYDKVIHRPDDMLEIISYYFGNCSDAATKNKRGKKAITKAMQKGFQLAISRFDKYAIAKYRGDGKKVKMIDVVNMIHVTPNQKNEEALKLLVANDLSSFDTWEVELTKAGQRATNDEEKAEFKKEAWAKLLSEKKIGYFALLRNLRNIIQQAPEYIDKALELLVDKRLISKSLVLPFRYLSAYEEISKLQTTGVFEKDGFDTKKVLKAIEDAILISVDNMPTLLGKTIILSDNSGSMRGDGGGSSLVSRLSNTKTSDIANLFAMLYWMKSDNTLVGIFGDNLSHPKLDRGKGLFDNFKIIDEVGRNIGGGTEHGIFVMFDRLINEKIIADTIVIFSDCQIGSDCKWYGVGHGTRHDYFMKLFSAYKNINPNFRCYSVDLKGYGTTVFDGSVIKISGWSEKIFDIMKFAEQDKNALIHEIEKIEL